MKTREKREHRVRYTDSQGRAIALFGELTCPAGDGKYPAVIFSHGFNGHYSDFSAACKRFAACGYVCYAFDFCGAQAGGRSTGRAADEYTCYTMVEDLKAAIADIRALPCVDGQVFLLGGSQGGLVTGLAAADDALRGQVSAIALYYPAFNIPDDWRGAPERETHLMGYSIGPMYIRAVQGLDPYAVIGGFDGDVCIVWGDRDAVVRRETIDRAVRAYGAARVALTVIPGAGHGFAGEEATAAEDAVLHFLVSHTAKDRRQSEA